MRRGNEYSRRTWSTQCYGITSSTSAGHDGNLSGFTVNFSCGCWWTLRRLPRNHRQLSSEYASDVHIIEFLRIPRVLHRPTFLDHITYSEVFRPPFSGLSRYFCMWIFLRDKLLPLESRQYYFSFTVNISKYINCLV